MKKTTSNDISLQALCKEDLAPLSATLRAADRAEMQALYGQDIKGALQECLARSVVAVGFFYKGKIAAAAGVEPEGFLGRRACVWSWSGAEAGRCSKAFWKVSKQVLQGFLALYPQLYAACDQRYGAAQRYIMRLGGRKVKKVSFHVSGPAFWIYEFNKADIGTKK